MPLAWDEPPKGLHFSAVPRCFFLYRLSAHLFSRRSVRSLRAQRIPRGFLSAHAGKSPAAGSGGGRSAAGHATASAHDNGPQASTPAGQCAPFAHGAAGLGNRTSARGNGTQRIGSLNRSVCDAATDRLSFFFERKGFLLLFYYNDKLPSG